MKFCKCWVPFFHIKQRLAPFLLIFSVILWTFSLILPILSQILHGFSEILPRFSTYQNIWGCAYTACTPDSYTTGSSWQSLCKAMKLALWRLLKKIQVTATMSENYLEVCKITVHLFDLSTKNYWRLEIVFTPIVDNVLGTPGVDPEGAIGAIAPPTTYESNLFHHDFLHIGKQNSLYKAILSSIVLSQQCCEVYFISLTVGKLLWDLTTKYYWNRTHWHYWLDPPLTYTQHTFIWTLLLCRVCSYFFKQICSFITAYN